MSKALIWRIFRRPVWGDTSGSISLLSATTWDLLRQCTEAIADLSRKLKLWVILGSNHRLTGRHKPHNSLYVINDCGSVVNRYDKMFVPGR